MNVRDATELRRASVRLALRFSAMILVLFGVLVLVTFVIVGTSQSEATARELIDASHVDSPRDAPPGVLVAVRSGQTLLVSADAPSWFPEAASLDAMVAGSAPKRETKNVSNHTYVIRTSMVGGRAVQTALDTRENAEELQRLALGLIVSGVLAAMASAVFGAFMARSAMKPMIDALALQRRFVTDASHELRTPLTLLSTRAQLLRRQLPASPPDGGPGPVASGLEAILQDTRDLTGILEDLLIAADPAGTFEREPVDLDALALRAVASAQGDALGRGIDLEITGSSDGVIVHGARVSLQRLFTALIANALDHARSRVTVEVRDEGRTATVRVQDDGPGFPPGAQSRAFERFFSSRPPAAENTRERHYGLGLALVAEVAARHNGSVEIEQHTAGPGATIVARIPYSHS